MQLRVWARRFFATLAQRSSGARGGSNPIYNLLPDIMSALVREPTLDPAGFNAIMEVRMRVLITHTCTCPHARAHTHTYTHACIHNTLTQHNTLAHNTLTQNTPTCTHACTHLPTSIVLLLGAESALFPTEALHAHPHPAGATLTC